MFIGQRAFLVKTVQQPKSDTTRMPPYLSRCLKRIQLSQAEHRIYAKGLYYMEPTAFHSNKRKVLEESVGGADVELVLCDLPLPAKPSYPHH